MEQGGEMYEGWCVAAGDRWAYRRVMTMEDESTQCLWVTQSCPYCVPVCVPHTRKADAGSSSNDDCSSC